MEIILHCVDPGHLKTKGLSEVFPQLGRFPMVSHCPHTRRIAVGSRTGHIALHELRGTKTQMLAAHGHAVSALSFSHDGKYLASFCESEQKLSLWQTTTGEQAKAGAGEKDGGTTTAKDEGRDEF